MRTATVLALLLAGCGAADEGGAPVSDAATNDAASCRPGTAPRPGGECGAEPRDEADAGPCGPGTAPRPGGGCGEPPPPGMDAARPDQGVPPDAAPPSTDCLGGVVRVGPLEIFAYEASRPDADGAGAGADTSRACSRAGVLPWTNVTNAQARAACEASGFHLCSDAEWEGACMGGRGWIFPYGEAHGPGRCNDHVSGLSVLRPTGDFADCATPEGVHDLSGNVWELTADGSRRGASFRVNAATFRVDAARCDTYYFASEAYYDDDVGFRCCR